ncbi:hypothetical protein [Phenylobacterium sp.]|uniref:hypothetical protein n=1 Tax=Phenylobacterium sp. TaxID=1871053 RepID=UPI002D03B229|nr:hypothetical protein [Phenylobacterium sp.]HVI30459.1 hypothetical protein [Phenylobacterium sp.]
MAGQDIQKQYNRDDEMKPGRPPRPSQEPGGAESSTRTDKTMTDPATGAPQGGAPIPNQSEADQSDDLDD